MINRACIVSLVKQLHSIYFKGGASYYSERLLSKMASTTGKERCDNISPHQNLAESIPNHDKIML